MTGSPAVSRVALPDPLAPAPSASPRDSSCVSPFTAFSPDSRVDLLLSMVCLVQGNKEQEEEGAR